MPLSLWWAPANPRLHRRPSSLAGSFGSASCGVIAPLLLSWCARNFVYVLQDWSLFFPSVLWKSYNQILLAFKSRFPGLPVPLLDPKAGKPDMGFRTFTKVREFLWHYCSPACGSPTQQIWDLIFYMTVCVLLSNCGFFFFFGCGVSSFGGVQCHPMEKAMATHSSTLAWKIPWTEEPGRLQSMGFRRVGHDWATSLSLFTFTHWRRKWQPTPVFLPGESQGRGSLVGCSLWGRIESDTTGVT